MHILSLPVFSLLIGAVFAAPGLAPFLTFSNVTVFVPPANYTDPQVLYARTVELEGGVLLATWENYCKAYSHTNFQVLLTRTESLGAGSEAVMILLSLRLRS